MSPEWNWGTDEALLTGSPAPALGHFICQFSLFSFWVNVNESMWETLSASSSHATIPKQLVSICESMVTFFNIIHSALSTVKKQFEVSSVTVLVILSFVVLQRTFRHLGLSEDFLGLSLRGVSARHFLTFCNFIKGFSLVQNSALPSQISQFYYWNNIVAKPKT